MINFDLKEVKPKFSNLIKFPQKLKRGNLVGKRIAKPKN